MKTEFDIMDFVSHDKSRPALNKPFSAGEGLICATDGHICAYTKGDAEVLDKGITKACAKFYDDAQERTEESLVPEFELKYVTCTCCQGTGKAVKCPSCEGEMQIDIEHDYTGVDGKGYCSDTYTVDCALCDGNGTVGGSDEDEYTCETCNGEGKYVDRGGVEIETQYFNKSLLARVCNLPDFKIFCNPSALQPARWTCKGAEGIILPWRKP